MKVIYGGLTPFDVGNRTRWTPGLGQVVHKFDWSVLEPSRGVYDFSTIDSLLAQLPGHVKLRLHIQGGDNAPAWLARVSGPFVDVTLTANGKTVPCGRYWEPGYRACWASFIGALGARYDSNARISGVNNAGCSLMFDEPFILGSDPDSVMRLFTAGLTQVTSQESIEAAMSALTTAFPTTVCELACHESWQYPDETGKLVRNWPKERRLLNKLDAVHGAHVIFTDYGLGPSDYTAAEHMKTAEHLYGWMHQRANEGRPVAWQLTVRSPITAHRVRSSILAGTAMGASWVEHSGFSLLDNTTVQGLDARLKSNV